MKRTIKVRTTSKHILSAAESVFRPRNISFYGAIPPDETSIFDILVNRKFGKQEKNHWEESSLSRRLIFSLICFISFSGNL